METVGLMEPPLQLTHYCNPTQFCGTLVSLISTNKIDKNLFSNFIVLYLLEMGYNFLSFFFIAEILLNLTKVNSVSRLRLLDYKGDLIYPSPIKLPVNTPDTAYYIQVLPETALNNNCK